VWSPRDRLEALAGRSAVAGAPADLVSSPKVFSREVTMGPTMKDLGIDRLNPEQRVALALEIWESLGDERPAVQLTGEQRAELVRRDGELEKDPGIALTWEEIRASVEAKP
jgi:putative addiction module component (TIGR02574 family)